MIKLWSVFIISALAIIIAGTKLSKYGDVIAIKTGLGQALVGSILIAGATSLPEVVTSATASLINSPDIAIGNVYGSNTFNLMILAAVDLLHGTSPFLLNVRSKHILSALLGILLSAIGVLSILSGSFLNHNFDILGIGMGSIFILITYIIGARLIYRYERKNQVAEEEEEIDGDMSLKEAIIKFMLVAVIIIVAGIKLSQSGDQIAALTGLERTFVGSILVAAATSLPEVVASFGAIKINAYDMAVGNVLGSNIFNMVIILVADLFYRQGPVLANVSLNHTVTALIGLILSSVVVIGLFYRSKKTFFNIGWDSFANIFIYLIGAYLLFNLGINF
ncbi:sodium:calcium antiporter [Selenihalanaerobacter shriftii]|uniref:Cation:H+ antiporter n=1 Tax=Selenihalanaerobacter shriftii TaxID=142842 RepID=A0A1T4L1S3_9FIRM|nr:sodium:calcium antiporter [Selenihalanaerobacter shriftii]SJZ48490.1 cation:H+ antiporter [Selenihalanaerobacter shriftii]